MSLLLSQHLYKTVMVQGLLNLWGVWVRKILPWSLIVLISRDRLSLVMIARLVLARYTVLQTHQVIYFLLLVLPLPAIQGLRLTKLHMGMRCG